MTDARRRDADAAADADARAQAQREFAIPLLLQAGAGTGKTAVLVSRLIAYSLGPGWERAAERLAKQGAIDASGAAPDEVARETLRGVVAITFTEAAAAEMGRRVGEALVDLLSDRDPIGVDRAALPMEPDLSARSRALLGALDQLTTRTFHAFCRRLLVAHPFEAGVHPELEVDVDGQAHAEVVREVLEARLPSVLASPLNPDWARLLDGGFGPVDVEGALLSLLTEGVTASDLGADPLALERVTPYLEGLHGRLQAFLELDAGRLAGVRGARSVSTAKMLARVEEELRAACEACRRREVDVRGLAGLFRRIREGVDSNDFKRLGVWSRGGFGAGEATAIGDDAEALAERARALRPLLGHLLELQPELLDAARRVLHSLLSDAEPALRARGVESFGGLLRRARDMLATSPGVARFERERMGLLLVDEFQDTDPMQCEILRLLALEGDPASRPSLFVVGDPKQSIYGWRSADLRAYQAFRVRLESEGGRVLPLEVNFRSVPAILDEVRRCVEPVMRAEPGVQPAFEPLRASEKTRDREGYADDSRARIEHWVLASGGGDDGLSDDFRATERSELEARAVAADLVALREAGCELGQVGLLFRSTSDFPIYLAALREAGIPFVVERETHHGKRREIVDATALVRCILDPHDTIAWVASLRSPVVGVPDAALAPLFEAGLPALSARLGGEDDAVLESARAAVGRAATRLEASGAAGEIPGLAALAGWPRMLSRFLEHLHALRRLHREAPPEIFVAALRRRLAQEAMESARHLGAYRVANLERFFQDLHHALEIGGAAPSVARYLRLSGSSDREQREGRPRALREDAVQVMTIHGSKGLDFDHVYLLQTHKGPPNQRERETRCFDTDGACVLLGVKSPSEFAHGEHRARTEQSERVRLLYVALTRARDRLVISGPARGFGPTAPKSGSQADLLADRTPARAADFGARLGASLAPDALPVDDEAGVRWRVVTPDSVPPTLAPSDAEAKAPSPERVEADAVRLVAQAEAARIEAGRTLARAASEREDFADEQERLRTDPFEAAAARASSTGEAEREVAMLAGTALHGVLEDVELDRLAGGAEEALERRLAARELAGHPSAQAVAERSRDALARFLAGPLPERLAGLWPRVVARELPVLVAPDLVAPEGAPGGDEAPPELWRGAVDLLYRDPEGRFVVADYKTDAVEGEALAARARAYAGQGAVYTAAVQAALSLPERPRFELWFLRAGAVVDPEGRAL
ncbi:MAG: UvrD-helicase domain-containing protein [Myxococcota bacterium]|nr:UvrD-helicase domain-containing protein [Myxococcota bacterium]